MLKVKIFNFSSVTTRCKLYPQKRKIFSLWLALLLLLPGSGWAQKSTAQRELNNQIEGLNYKTQLTNKRQLVHILEVDPQKLMVIAAKAKNLPNKRETLKDLANRQRAIAAINGGFFRTNGQPAGILKIKEKFYGIAYRPRAAIGWERRGNTTLIDRLQTRTGFYINNYKMPVNLMNRPLSAKRAVLFTNGFAGYTKSGNTAQHAIIKDGKIVAIQLTDPDNLPEDTDVYSLGRDIVANYPALRVGDSAQIKITMLPQLEPQTAAAWEQMDFIVGGTPLLIHHGKVIDNFQTEKLNTDFFTKRYARTAIGILPNNNWILVVVESNVFLNRQGMTIAELADFMHSLGCVQALNLDGGGSSAMYLQGRIINHADEEGVIDALLRPISDAILIIQARS